MKSTYLVQRLLKPPKEESLLASFGDAIAFGGGYKNGGLSDEAFKLIKSIFRFDYMGSAEYEFGEVPKALEWIFKDRTDYAAFGETFRWHKSDWKRQKDSIVKEVVKSDDIMMYVICRSADKEEVVERIKDLCKGLKSKIHTKGYAAVPEACEGERYKEVKGWLELDNGFFFFIDKEMFEKTCELFGLKTDLVL